MCTKHVESARQAVGAVCVFGGITSVTLGEQALLLLEEAVSPPVTMPAEVFILSFFQKHPERGGGRQDGHDALSVLWTSRGPS